MALTVLSEHHKFKELSEWLWRKHKWCSETQGGVREPSHVAIALAPCPRCDEGVCDCMQVLRGKLWTCDDGGAAAYAGPQHKPER